MKVSGGQRSRCDILFGFIPQTPIPHFQPQQFSPSRLILGCSFGDFIVVFFVPGRDFEGYRPLWFHQRTDELTGETIYVYKGGYWEAKERQDWNMCPEIF